MESTAIPMSVYFDDCPRSWIQLEKLQKKKVGKAKEAAKDSFADFFSSLRLSQMHG